MATDTRYTLLLASLPYHGPLFGSKQPPLSRLRLDQRLTLLDPADAERLRQIEDLLQWSNLSIERSDDEIVRQAQATVMALDHPQLQQIVTSRLEVRTLVAALRRRERGESAPPRSQQRWGYGRWLTMIEQHWNEPGFRLQGAYPWLVQAENLLQAGDSLGLERLLLSVVWQQLARAGEDHYFDFVAVVVYVLRWNVIDRWTTYNRSAAAERFATLIDSGLGRFANVFESPPGTKV